MQHATAIEILTRQGLQRDGDVFHAPTGVVVSVYLAYGSQTLILDRVGTVAVTAETAIITTSRKEAYGVELADMRAIRTTPEASGPGYR